MPARAPPLGDNQRLWNQSTSNENSVTQLPEEVFGLGPLTLVLYLVLCLVLCSWFFVLEFVVG
jgi:hypothetical protein